MACKISDKADVDPRAELGDDVEVGPFCFVGPDVTIGSHTRLHDHVSLTGRVTIGSGNEIFPHCVIGAAPQDLSYRGSPTRVVIGDDNTIRECVTVNRATEKEDGVTVVGNSCYLMACCHVAHDCRIGNHVVIANATLLGGHVRVYDHATLSGGVGVHHFATIGSYSFVSGHSRVVQDVPPFMLVDGMPSRPRCVNVVALKRNSFPKDDIAALAEAHRLIYRSRVDLEHAREVLRSRNLMRPVVNHLFGFIQCQQEGRHGRSRERRMAA